MGADWFRDFWAALWASDIKWTDLAIVVFTFGQVWVGMRQAAIARRQTEIADETRQIAVAALGRPYILVEGVPHDGRIWRHKDNLLVFTFRLMNYGAGPAIIDEVRGSALFSKRRKPGTVQFIGQYLLPEPGDLKHSWGHPPLVLAEGEAPPQSKYRFRAEGKGLKTTLVIPPGNSSPIMAACRITKEGADVTDDKGDLLNGEFVEPWLLGRVAYRTVYNTLYYTQFCWCGGGSGQVTETYGPPYNERT